MSKTNGIRTNHVVITSRYPQSKLDWSASFEMRLFFYHQVIKNNAMLILRLIFRLIYF